MRLTPHFHLIDSGRLTSFILIPFQGGTVVDARV